MHAISSYHGNRPTNTPTNTPTDRTDYNTLYRSQLARSVIIKLQKDRQTGRRKRATTSLERERYPKYLHAEVLEALVRLPGGQQHLDEELRVVHVGDGLVEGVHDQQGVVLQSLTGAEVCPVYRAKLLEHRHDVRASFKHSAAHSQPPKTQR